MHHPPRGHTLKSLNDRLIVISQGSLHFSKSPTEIGWCRKTTTYSTKLCVGLQSRIAELPELLLPHKRW